MGLRFRRTVKIAPGIRLNFNKNSVGVSIGPRGAKYTINSSGRRTASVGIPGTGIYYTESVGGGRRKTVAPQPTGPLNNRGQALHLDSPGVFAKGGEEAFFQFANDYLLKGVTKPLAEIKIAADKVRQDHPEIANLIDFVMIAPIAHENAKEALPIVEKIYALGPEIFNNIIAKKYFDEFQVSIPIARGINFLTDYQHNYIIYTYSEILQALGQPEKALEIIQKAPESDYKEVAILDLYLSLKRYEDVIDETEDTENEDDFTAIKLIFRSMAMSQENMHDVAIETFTMALAKKSRSEDILNFARYERANTYLAMGKKAMAIKDLNKILAVDYDNQDARDKLEEIQK